MKDYELKLLLHFMEQLGRRFSSAGCNDFDMTGIVPKKEQKDFAIRALRHCMGEQEFESEYAEDLKKTKNWSAMVMDHMALKYLVDLVKSGGLTKVIPTPPYPTCKKHGSIAPPLEDVCDGCFDERLTESSKLGEYSGLQLAASIVLRAAIGAFEQKKDEMATYLRLLSDKLASEADKHHPGVPK